jgi:hypothetical protein
MNRSLKSLALAALSIVGPERGQSIADERDDIWWELVSDYNGTNQTVCLAENNNDFRVHAIFELSPIRFDFDGNPVPGRVVVILRPHRPYKLYAWPNSFNPHCSLRSYAARNR